MMAIRENYLRLPLIPMEESHEQMLLARMKEVGIGVFDKIAKHAGAGTLVPITGFSNAITSPAIEFKSEGYILGVGAKMFVIAGPVIVYGVLSSVVAGIIKYFMM